MKFVVIILVLLGIVGAIVGASALQRPAAPGELAFEKDSFDAGNVPLGQTVLQRYSMRNMGGKPVTILKADVAVLQGC